jgi:phosphatidylinositol N-acetylglucosaminyltransferase subunit Q
VAVNAGVELLVGLMNHFPLFALLLRTKDPRRLPGTLLHSILTANQGAALTD